MECNLNKKELKIINWKLPSINEIKEIGELSDYFDIENKSELCIWTEDLKDPSKGDRVYKTYDIINKTVKSSEEKDIGNYLLLISENKKNKFIIYKKSYKFAKTFTHIEAIKRLNAINLNNAVFNLSEPSKKELHLIKLGEKSSELNHRIFETMFNNNKNLEYNSNILDGISDMLNSVEVYLKAIDIDKSELSLYRLNQLKKHL